MNSERRHELQENELASALDKINKKIDPYSKPIAAAVAAGFIGLLGWGFYSSTQSEKRSDATYQLIEGSIRGDSEILAAVAASYPNTPMAAWSRLYQGSQKMGAGMNALFNSRDEAEELLGEAATAYKEAISLSKDTLILSRANFGLARIAESLGNTDEAIASYEAVMAAGESDAMVTEAKNRIEILSNPAAGEFLAWFGEQDFSPADPSLPPSLPSDQMLPDLPDLEFPEIEADMDEEEVTVEDADSEETMTEETVTEEPAAEMNEEAAETEASASAEDTPAEETPAEDSASSETETPSPETTEESAPEPSSGEESGAGDESPAPSNS
ncbi:putative negative regulator of RcsB-dependent stress response [Rhodopirellula rubra]|uniref:Putative negative regulator of RcsB-dependent stress response n=1 Tax=Aporhodopirellula rubra TaxID=980271 RepID=A0A7W5H946_9BACT|nr:tetratricopeptide repeat protein [Aporhodopirellula rubra]MBB3209721.1 putative negative regulator of RcsB-dependent stress response [Aporhodopirellula rubra]